MPTLHTLLKKKAPNIYYGTIDTTLKLPIAVLKGAKEGKLAIGDLDHVFAYP